MLNKKGETGNFNNVVCIDDAKCYAISRGLTHLKLKC